MSDITTPTPDELTERYGSMFNTLIEGIQIIDKQHRYLYVNDAAVKQNKYTREELIGRTQLEMYPGIEKTEVFAKMSECIEKGTPTYIENEFQFPDGSKGWYEVRTEPLEYGAIILSLDITNRKNADLKLQEQQVANMVEKERAENLAKMNAGLVDRELKMVELKEQIQSLEKEMANLKKTTP